MMENSVVKHSLKFVLTLISILAVTGANAQLGNMPDRKSLLKQLRYLKERSANQGNNRKAAEAFKEQFMNANSNPNNNPNGANQPPNRNQQTQQNQQANQDQQDQQNQQDQADQNQQNQNQQDKEQPVKTQQLRKEAFSRVTQQLLPLTPKQIKQLHKMFDEVRRAADEHPGEPPRPTSSSLVVDLAPGAAPPVVRMASGYVSTLVFLDETGAPWPIEAYDIGNPQSFNIQWNKKSNMLMIQARGDYKSGNLVVKLRDKNTPVLITLMPDQKSVDYRVDMHVPGEGPNAQPRADTLPATPSSTLLQILDGVPPEKAKRLNVSGGEARAWLYGNKLYLRTRMTILSPSWDAVMTSTDGMHAYELTPSPVILVSHHGQMVRLRIEGLT